MTHSGSFFVFNDVIFLSFWKVIFVFRSLVLGYFSSLWDLFRSIGLKQSCRTIVYVPNEIDSELNKCGKRKENQCENNEEGEKVQMNYV